MGKLFAAIMLSLVTTVDDGRWPEPHILAKVYWYR